ncbi:hypothetical protein MBLNU459_g2430t2 [Dothideomycetes sp. NU459]
MDSLGLDPATTTWGKAKWLFYKGSIERIVGRLQNYKSSLSLMLNILQCAYLREAQKATAQLTYLIESALNQNPNLLSRFCTILSADKTISSATSPKPSFRDQLGTSVDDDALTVKSHRESLSIEEEKQIATWQARGFERVLSASRVYQRLGGSDDFSLTSSMSPTSL